MKLESEHSSSVEKSRIENLQKALQSSQALVSQLKDKINLLEIEKEQSITNKEFAEQVNLWIFLCPYIQVAKGVKSKLRREFRLTR